ncbi:MAG: hypothetical protein WAW06_01435 [bacterium]
MSPSSYKCPLCGREFDAADRSCRSCPMARTCKVVCCPGCGYGFPAESSLVGWLKRLLGKSDKNKGKKEEPR